MSEETKKIIDELSDLSLELFRSAANLDDLVEDMAMRMEDLDPVPAKAYANYQKRYRENIAAVNGYYDLIDKEKELWQKLIESM